MMDCSDATANELRESDSKKSLKSIKTLTSLHVVVSIKEENTDDIKLPIGFKSIDKICARLQLNQDKDTKPNHREEEEIATATIDQDIEKEKTMLLCTQQPTNENDASCSSVLSEEVDLNLQDDTEALSMEEDSSYEQASVIVIPTECYEEANSNAAEDSHKYELDNIEKPQLLVEAKENQQQKTNSNQSGINSHKLKPRNSTHYNSWHYTDMILAIKAVQTKNLSMTAAAKKYSIPRTTLRHYLNDGTNKEAKRAGFCLPKPQENTLVGYALQHSALPEKQLYKYIFDRAKELSRDLTTVQGEEERRIVPTPAWIRRFVYRQKRLHDLFPTLLSKFEHPLHGGRKSPTDIELTYESGLEREKAFEKEASSMVPSRRVSTEIIFPKRSPDDHHHRFDVANSPNEQHRNSITHEVSNSPNSFQGKSRTHSEGYASSETSPTRKQFVPLSSSSSSSAMFGNTMEKDVYDYWQQERGAKKTKTNQHLQLKIEDEHVRLRYNEERPLITSYKEHRHLPPALIDQSSIPINSTDLSCLNNNKMHNRKCCETSLVYSTTQSHPEENPYNSLDERAPQHVDEIYSSKITAKLFNRNSPYMNGCGIPINSTSYQPVGSNIDLASQKRYESPCYSSEENISSHSPVLQQNGFETSRNNSFEVCVMNKSLDAMEYELGKDYVNLFTERYLRNRKLERLYCKWVALKSDLERAERMERNVAV